jgi:hypothetical protein
VGTIQCRPAQISPLLPGYIETSVRLPGANNILGLWPAVLRFVRYTVQFFLSHPQVWTMGNLGRAGYGASLEGMWPYSYGNASFSVTFIFRSQIRETTAMWAPLRIKRSKELPTLPPSMETRATAELCRGSRGRGFRAAPVPERATPAPNILTGPLSDAAHQRSTYLRSVYFLLYHAAVSDAAVSLLV